MKVVWLVFEMVYVVVLGLLKICVLLIDEMMMIELLFILRRGSEGFRVRKVFVRFMFIVLF